MSEDFHKRLRNQLDFQEKEGPEWLEQWVKTNPLVYCHYSLWRRGEITWEQMLVSLAKELLKLNAIQAKMLLKLRICENTVLVFPDGKRLIQVTEEQILKNKPSGFEMQAQGLTPDDLPLPGESEL